MRYLLVMTILWGACQVPSTPEAKPTDFKDFPSYWTSFQQAISDNDTARVAQLTYFPLSGVHPDGPITAQNFADAYPSLFNSLAVQTIINTKTEEVSSFTISEDVYQGDSFVQIGVAEGTQVKRLDVLYIYGEGDNKTESSVSFCFAKLGAYYRLCQIMIAG